MVWGEPQGRTGTDSRKDVRRIPCIPQIPEDGDGMVAGRVPSFQGEALGGWFGY